jgi:hypothetical protein
MFVLHNFLVSRTLIIGCRNPKAKHRTPETPNVFNSETIQLTTDPQIFCYAFTSFIILIPFVVVLLG